MYADASALVKLVVEETESAALERALEDRDRLYTSRLAVVEVTRAAVVANPGTGFSEATKLFEGCEFIDVDAVILERARALADARLRTLDAIHLASALLLGPDELITYDRRLVEAAQRLGFRTTAPGA